VVYPDLTTSTADSRATLVISLKIISMVILLSKAKQSKKDEQYIKFIALFFTPWQSQSADTNIKR
jgi:hypothetical protein